jgi:hypothetical protein
MTSKEISEQLEGIASAKDFESSSAELTEAWSAAGVGIESVQPILRFMEEHPELDYGSPGPLVHFVEEVYLKGYKWYEEELIQSMNRRPTIMSVWMLNRVLNGTEEPTRRRVLIETMTQAAKNPKANQATVELIRDFLEG